MTTTERQPWRPREVTLSGRTMPTLIQIEQVGRMPRAQVFHPMGYDLGDDERALARRIVDLLNRTESDQ